MNFLKLSWIANRRADTETNIETNRWTQKSKNLYKTNTAVVNAGPPDTQYLYYQLDVEDVTLMGSLLPPLR